MFSCCTSSSRSLLHNNRATIEELTAAEASRRIKNSQSHLWKATFSAQEQEGPTKNFSVTFQQHPYRDFVLYLNIASSPYVQNQKSRDIGFRVVNSIANDCFAYGNVRLDQNLYFQGKHHITQVLYDPLTCAVTFMLEQDSAAQASNYVFQSLELRPEETTKKKH